MLSVLVCANGPARARKTRVTGRIIVSKTQTHCSRVKYAYWMYEVPDLPHPPCRKGLHSYLVTLNKWNSKRAAKLLRNKDKTAVVKLHGVQLEPRMLVVPKEGQSYEVTITNTDRFRHQIFSPHPKHKDVGSGILEPGSSTTVRFESLPAVEEGKVAYVPLRCRRFGHIKGGVAFVRSTFYSRVGARGRFSLPRVERGTYVLRVWNRGKQVHKREIKVRRRTLRVKIDLRPEEEKQKAKKKATPRPDKNKKQSDKKRRRRRRRRRRTRRRRR
jgi:hypothetical protein